MPGTFRVPEVAENEEGWGPTTVPEHLDGVPYAPFGKGDKIGRISDFTQQGGGYNKYGGRGFQQGREALGTPVFNFFHNEEEDSFLLVDNRPTTKNRGGGRRFGRQNFQQHQHQRRDDGGPAGKHAGRGEQHLQRSKAQRGRGGYQNYHRNDQRQVVYSSSVDIRPEWTVEEQIPFTSLAKLHCSVGEPQELAACGALEYYDKAFDRITPKTERAIKRTGRAFRNVTTSDDPIIRRLASEDKARVFITDGILTTLMCAPRSVYSWDIVVTRAGDKLFFDKRDAAQLDLLTVAETAPESIAEEKDSINGVQQLSVEATAINQNFSQQVLLPGDKLKFDEPNPFAESESEELASVAYKYRRYVIDKEEEIALVVRCELDAVLNQKGQEQLLSIKTLNEFDPRITGVDWRMKIENQRGAVLATELKNNANKLAKWTAAALVAGADLIKLGYVSRVHPKDPYNHVILSTQGVKPRDFAMQINLNMDNCWGIVRALVDLALKLDDGKYLLVKDPNKPILRLYGVPEDAFEQNYTEEPLPETEEAPAEPEPQAPKAEDKDDADE